MDWGLAATGGVLGAVFGSFASTAALRIADGRDPFRGRSACDGCARALGWFETVPVAGGLIAKGRCTTCQHPIDPFHLAGEVLGAFILAVSLGTLKFPDAVVIGTLGLLLLMQALIDYKTFRLPDTGNAMIAAVCLIMAWMKGNLVEGLVTASLTYALLTGLRYLMKRRHGQDMLGGGDIKLMTALAIGLGMLTPWLVAGAALLTLSWTYLKRPRLAGARIPFGPGLALMGTALSFCFQGGIL